MTAPNFLEIKRLNAFTKIFNFGNTFYSNILVNPANTTTRINNIIISNSNTTTNSSVNLAFVDYSNSNTSVLIADRLFLPSNSSVTLFDKNATLVLDELDYLRANSNVILGLSILVTYETYTDLNA